MSPNASGDLSRTIENPYRSESGRILATLARLVGDLDLAEEVMHEAFAAALETWLNTGLPDKPRPWLISAGRFKAIDMMRRRGRFEAAQSDLRTNSKHVLVKQASLKRHGKRRWRTIVFVSSLPAAILHCRRKGRSRSHCGKSAA
jgi:predicted RNA polymerase sigma factor